MKPLMNLTFFFFHGLPFKNLLNEEMKLFIPISPLIERSKGDKGLEVLLYVM